MSIHFMHFPVQFIISIIFGDKISIQFNILMEIAQYTYWRDLNLEIQYNPPSYVNWPFS